MRTCSVCKIKKEPSEFYFKDKKRGWLHSQCKACYAVKRKGFMEEHYRKYGDQYRERARKRKRMIKKLRQEQIVTYLAGKGCEGCGFTDIRALDFDHIDPMTKKFSIARAINDCYAWEEIQKEIKKCKILCANCHRIRTAEQFGWRKWHLSQALVNTIME